MNFPKITLKAARVNADLTQQDASSKLGIDCRTLQNYEAGKTVPDWDVVRKMEELYQISADYLRFV